MDRVRSINGGEDNAYGLLVGKSLGKRPKCRWVDNIKKDLGEIRWGGMNWNGLAQIGTSGGLL
jgi:hypothetical protein